MTRTPLRRWMLAVALIAAVTGSGAVPAAAQNCLSPVEIRAAVQSGRVVSMRDVVANVTGNLGGEVVSLPTLCFEGGRLFYHFTVLSKGHAIPVDVDARTGQMR